MAAYEDVKIVNKGNSDYAIVFRGVAPFKNRRNQPAMNVNLIGTSPENTFLFRFIGQAETATYTFAIFDDDTDVADGSYTGTVKTVDEQVAYLKNEIYTSAYNDYWTIYQERFFPVPMNCVITDLSFDNPAGGVALITGSITIMIGRIGSV